jgi:hypothetical protein
MEILEGWQNHNGAAYAVGRNCKGSYVALWNIDRDIWDFTADPGLDVATFDSVEAAKAFLLGEVKRQQGDPETCLHLLDDLI